MKYSILEIAEILGADASHLNNASIDTLLTDSRTLTYPDRSLFFALHTDSNDGHRYVHQLYEKGVHNFVVEHIPEGVPTGDANFIVVKNSIKALQQLASFHRHRFHIPVIGVTGSRGKTQVKEWLFQLLRPDYNIVRSPRSYNSQIGVPLSVWDIDDNTGLAIIEAGISQPDEMPVLESIISPDITVMTNIGNEHKEGFASIEEKCIEKLRLSRNSKYIVFDGDNNTICNGIIDLSYGHQEVSWSRVNTDAPIFISSIIKEKDSTTINYTYLLYAGQVKIPFTAAADIENAIVCLATLLCMRVPMDTIEERFKLLSPTGTRMDAMEGVNDCQLIHDTYTSDYLSLAPAIDFMSRRARIHRPKLTLTALHVRMANIDYESDTTYLEDFAAARGVRLIVRETSFDPSTDTRKSPCFLCSWNRRKMLFTVAQELGCHKIALGHHQDDILHTLLLNLSFQGQFGTMPARLQMRKFPMTIIRPLCMVHERDLAAWAALQGYRKQKKLCPYETDSHRSDIKQIFGQLEQLNPEARYSLWNALEQEGKLVE